MAHSSSPADAPSPANRRMLMSARLSDVAGVRDALADGADLLARDPTGRLGIHWACEVGCHEALALLISERACAARDGNGRTPLMICANTNDGEAARMLIDANPSIIDEEDDDHHTPAMVAAYHGHVQALGAIAPRCQLDLRDRDGLDALMHAAYAGKAEALRILLACGAPISKNLMGFDPLMLAAKKGREDCVMELLPISDLHGATVKGHTALSLARHYEHGSVVQILERAMLVAHEREQLGQASADAPSDSGAAKPRL